MCMEVCEVALAERDEMTLRAEIRIEAVVDDHPAVADLEFTGSTAAPTTAAPPKTAASRRAKSSSRTGSSRRNDLVTGLVDCLADRFVGEPLASDADATGLE